jgi:hypothetical protein
MALVGVQELPGGRVLFGPGALARVPEESSRLGVTAVMLVAAAHCATTLAARAAGPLDALFAEHGLRALAASLPACVDRPGDLAARQEALRAPGSPAWPWRVRARGCAGRPVGPRPAHRRHPEPAPARPGPRRPRRRHRAGGGGQPQPPANRHRALLRMAHEGRRPALSTW